LVPLTFISVADAVLDILVRLVLRPFTFSNGTTVPAGTCVAAPLSAVHTDGEIYPNPDEFDGFRFAKLREREDGMGSRHQTASDRHYVYDTLVFRIRATCMVGYFSSSLFVFVSLIHICVRNSPGRSFATVEMKALLAQIVITYDLKLEEGKKVPSQVCIATSSIIRDTDVLFRKRHILRRSLDTFCIL
jgi:cytochrome P450